MLHAMVLSMYIQGSILSDLSSSIYGKPIENIIDLLKSNLPIKTLNGVSYLFQFSTSETDLQVYKRIEILEKSNYPFEAGSLAINRKNFATIVDTGELK